MIPSAAVERFRADLAALTQGSLDRLGIAVSGGPDSLALLLLAHAAFAGQVEVATVDHRLRSESTSEAEHVAAICARLGVPHTILPIHWDEPPATNIPARARDARYRALIAWAELRGLPLLATAHHLDDQAETILMRLARGAGLRGLAGVPPVSHVYGEGFVTVVRPLLGWRKNELVDLVTAHELDAVDDPINHSERLDRTHFRRLLASASLLEPHRLARSAANLAEAEEALQWMTERLYMDRHEELSDDCIALDATELPPELKRRLLLRVIDRFTSSDVIPGPKVTRLLALLEAGRPATLAGLKCTPGARWRIEPAPPRRPAP